MYIFLSVVPIFLATICAFVLCVINKGGKTSGQSSNRSNGYMMVSTSDTNALINDEDDNGDTYSSNTIL